MDEIALKCLCCWGFGGTGLLLHKDKFGGFYIDRKLFAWYYIVSKITY